MVSMHVLAMLGVGLLATAGGAQASSFVTLGVSTSTPSFIKVGTPEPIKMASASTPSIVTLGDLVPRSHRREGGGDPRPARTKARLPAKSDGHSRRYRRWCLCSTGRRTGQGHRCRHAGSRDQARGQAGRDSDRGGWLAATRTAAANRQAITTPYRKSHVKLSAEAASGGDSRRAFFLLSSCRLPELVKRLRRRRSGFNGGSS